MEEIYIIKETDKNTWTIIDENEKIVVVITKDTIVNYCKKECKKNDTCSYSAEMIIDDVWWCIKDKFSLEFVNSDCQEWDKFCAWFDYICVKCLASELITVYKQRLLTQK